MSFVLRTLLASLTFAAAAGPAAAWRASEADPEQPGWARWASAHEAFGFDRSGFADEPRSTGSIPLDRVVLSLDGDRTLGIGLGASEPAPSAIRARVGYAFGRFVAYGTAGVAFGSAEFVRAGRDAERVPVGFTVGGGIETALFGGIVVKAEYLHVDIDRAALVDADIGLASAAGLFRAGFNYRF